MLIFHQITIFLGGKCARIKKLDMKWIKVALEYCTFTLISSLVGFPAKWQEEFVYTRSWRLKGKVCLFGNMFRSLSYHKTILKLREIHVYINLTLTNEH